MFLPCIALVVGQRQEIDKRIAIAFRRACELQGLPMKIAEDVLALDHGQAQDQWSGIDRSQILTRIALAASERRQGSLELFGVFLGCLAQEFGGGAEVVAHLSGQMLLRALRLVFTATDADLPIVAAALRTEAAGVLGKLWRALAPTPGRARQLRASLTPRSKESGRCVHDSLSVSA
jgi:hypothetical protein